MLAMYINSEASTIVKNETGLEGIVAWTSLHAKYSRRTLGKIYRVQRECMYPKLAKDVGRVRLDFLQWEGEAGHHNVGARERCENSRRAESPVTNMPKQSETAEDDDDAG